MSGMKMPEWYTEAKEKMGTVLSEPPPPMNAPPEMEKITDLPYVFAEYQVKASDVLLHLFPRAGETDQWTDGHYVNRCRNCRAEVPVPENQKAVKKCPKCGHSGLVYIPGRSEEASKVKFPANARDVIKEAVDAAWMGDVAIELVPELGAYVVQLQQARNTANTVGLEKFVRKTCLILNGLLAPKN